MPPGIVGSVDALALTRDAIYVAGSLEDQGVYVGVMRLRLADAKRDTTFVHASPAPVYAMAAPMTTFDGWDPARVNALAVVDDALIVG